MCASISRCAGSRVPAAHSAPLSCVFSCCEACSEELSQEEFNKARGIGTTVRHDHGLYAAPAKAAAVPPSLPAALAAPAASQLSAEDGGAVPASQSAKDAAKKEKTPRSTEAVFFRITCKVRPRCTACATAWIACSNHCCWHWLQWVSQDNGCGLKHDVIPQAFGVGACNRCAGFTLRFASSFSVTVAAEWGSWGPGILFPSHPCSAFSAQPMLWVFLVSMHVYTACFHAPACATDRCCCCCCCCSCSACGLQVRREANARQVWPRCQDGVCLGIRSAPPCAC